MSANYDHMKPIFDEITGKNKRSEYNKLTELKKQIEEVLSEIAWLKEPEEDLDFTSYYYYQALLDIKNIIESEGKNDKQYYKEQKNEQSIEDY